MGEPGIGKTRTALELATYAGLRQAQVLWGRCYEGEGAPPYWPWVQDIRSYVRDVDSEQLRSEMGAGATDVAEVVSDVKEQLPGLQSPPQLEPEQARFRLFDSITAFLKSAGQSKPLVPVLDDLHWADHPSLLLLEFVARELANARVMIIGTYRDMELSRQHPLSRTLGELTKERLFQRVLLRGLDQDDVVRFIELASGVNPPAGMLEAVYNQTEGNPLFVTEVVRLLVEEGELTHESGHRDSWSVRIPEGVREVIRRRLDRLSERCNETLTTASVIGRQFTLENLSPLIEDMTEDRLLEVLEEALSARVIEELPRTVGRYQFTHALIQETLAEELSTTRKVRLHARIAETLEEFYRNDVEAHAAELANHFNQAQTVLGTDRLVRYSLLAGDRALANYANEDAQAHFERALNSMGVSLSDNKAAADEQSAEVLFGLGRVQASTLPQHEFGKAVVSLTRAFKYFSEVGNLERALAVAEHPIYSSGGQRNGVSLLISEAIALVPPDSLEAARLLIRYGVAINQEEGNWGVARDALSRALVISRREGDLALEMHAEVNTSLVALMHFIGVEGRDDVLRAIELAQEVDDPLVECVAHFAAGWLFANIGDLEATRLHFASALGLAEKHRVRNWIAYNLWASGLTAQVSGDWVTQSVSASGIEQEFSERVLGCLKIDEGWQAAILGAMSKEGPEPDHAAEIRRIKAASANLRKQHLWNVIGDEEFKADYQELQRQKRALAPKPPARLSPNLNRAAGLLSDLPALWKHPGVTQVQRRELAREAFDEIRLRDGKLVAVKPRAQYALLFAYSLWNENRDVGGEHSP